MATTKWALDPTHSELQFKVKHLMIANVSGSFGKFDVQLETKGEDFTTAIIAVSAETNSITTGNEARDAHLLNGDFFDVEKSELLVAKEPNLILIAKLISLYGNVPIFVRGYTDNVGYDVENVKRTTQQANDVAAVLWSYGLDKRYIHVQGYGSKLPIANNGSMKGREMNRRIEIWI